MNQAKRSCVLSPPHLAALGDALGVHVLRAAVEVARVEDVRPPPPEAAVDAIQLDGRRR